MNAAMALLACTCALYHSTIICTHSMLVLAIPDGQNFYQKVQALAIIKSKYLYTRRKVSVSSAERSPLVVANFVDAEVTCVFNFSHTNFN